MKFDHAAVIAAIAACGGRIVASFDVVAGEAFARDPRTPHRSHRCTVCGGRGHNSRSCPDNP